MQLSAVCSASVGNFEGGIVKILLTVLPSSDNNLPEYVLLNLHKSRVEFEEGDVIEVTLKKKNIAATSP